MEQLRALSPLTVMEYIRSTVDVLTTIKQEAEPQKPPSESSSPEEYERMLQAAEEELRNHVRVRLCSHADV